MMRDLVVDIFEEALARGAAEGRWPALRRAFSVEPPRDPRHGDFAVNAAMVLAKAGRPAAPRAGPGAVVEASAPRTAAGRIEPRWRSPARAS